VHAVCERAEIGMSVNCVFNGILVETYSVLHAMSQIKNRYIFMLLKEDSLVL
jgi:hypothetical protein